MTEHSFRRPPWLKVPAFGGERYHQIRKKLRQLSLHTVCEEANCPNRGECFNSGTATFLLMGPTCSRHCRFCNISGGNPARLDHDEPEKIAAMVAELELSHVVLTSVTRDDLPDKGAGHFGASILELKKLLAKATIEVLTPDFSGRRELLDIVLKTGPDVFNHNVETVEKLYRQVRPQADLKRSLGVLDYAAKQYPDIKTKSGLMVGLGESIDELEELFGLLYNAGVEILTIGQYLAPSQNHHPVRKYYSPEEFSMLAKMAENSGIPIVMSGPLIRSSYRAGTLLE